MGDASPKGAPGADESDAQRLLTYDRFRRVTARRLTDSVVTKPHVTLHRYAVLTEVEAAVLTARETSRSPDLGLTPTLLKLIAVALSEDDRLNGVVEDRTITLHRTVDLGVAVDVRGALVVPVVRDSGSLSVEAIGRTLRRLAAAAQAGTLRPEDVTGATFTVTSLGAMGVDLFAPIINPPQLAILGVGAVSEHVVLVEGEARPQRRIGLSLSFDHAATDGSEAARVLGHLCHTLEKPPVLPWTDDERLGDLSDQVAAAVAHAE